ncbi:MAG TPA: extracellular solute-binding protein [Sedimentisphaerales bacterium]|nr:extracellular solute-binding protein [Sedimentisphaerales bacterium]
MRKKKTAICTGIFAMLAVLFVALLLCCRQRPSQERARVVLYCSVDQVIAEPIIAEFEKQTGIKVAARFDTEATKTVGLIQKIRAEGVSPIADVFWSNEIFHTIRLAHEGLLAPYEGPSTKDWPALLHDAEGKWYGFALRARVIAYNTQRVSREQAPQTLEEVLDPKWKGRLIMAAAEFGTTGGDVASWFAHYGFDRAHRILQALKANRVRLVDGNSTAVRMIAMGQADVCFTDTDDVYAAQRNGWPVAMNYLDQGGNGPLVIPNTAAVINGAPHPELAKRLMEFLLSEKCEQMLAQSDSHNSPVHPSLAEEFRTYAIPRPLSVDYKEVADQLPTAIKTAGEVLR